MIRRFINALRFYVMCVGWKGVLKAELPNFIDQAKEECKGLKEIGYKPNFLEELVTCMEDAEDAYID